jgi:hypothetical protein
MNETFFETPSGPSRIGILDSSFEVLPNG